MASKRAHSSNATATAINAAAPADERHDATVEVHRAGLGDLIPASELAPVIDYINSSMEDADFAKSLNRNVIPFPPKNRGERGGQSVFIDDFQIASQGYYYDPPGLLGFDSLRAMVAQTPVLNGIVLTRQRQVMRFCRPQMRQADAGFIIGHVDSTIELNDEQQQSVKLLEQFIINSGWERDPRKRKRLKRETFANLMAKSVRDTLTMDAAPFETEFKRDRSLGLDGIYAIDGASIRLCTEEGYEGDDEIFAVQVVEGIIRTAYTYDDLVYEVRNPRSDVTAYGYGYSETEMLVRVVTYLLNTMTYNGSFFNENAIPRGILNIYGNYDNNDLAAFRRYWNSMVRGIKNAHSMPVLVSKDRESGSQFTEVGGQLDEMQFAKWLSFLTSIACAIHGMDPVEISMESFATSKSSLSGSDTEERLVSSSDKGLRPLLSFYENTISDYIIQPFSPEYMLRFVGLDADDAKNRFEMRKLTLTVNEGRASIDEDPLEGPLGDAPLNQTLLTVWQQLNGIGQPEQPEEDFGDPEAAEGGPPKGGVGPGDGAPAKDGQDQGSSQDQGAEDGAPDFGTGSEQGAGLAKAFDFGLPVFRIEA